MKKHVDALFKKVKQHYTAGEYTQFFELIDNALLIAEQDDDMESFVDFILKKVSAYFQFGDYEIAIQTLAEVEPLIGERPSEARIRFMSAKASVYGGLEDSESCYKYLCAAKELAEEQRSIENLVTIEANLCHYWLQKERYEEAEVALHHMFEWRALLEQQHEHLPVYIGGHTRYIQLHVKLNKLEEAAARIAYVEAQPDIVTQPHYKYFVRAIVAYECATGRHDRAYERLKLEMERFANDASLYSYFYEYFVEEAEHIEPLEQYVQTLEEYYHFQLQQQQQQQQQRAERMAMYFKTDHLEQLIWLDPLTQIKNRRYLEDQAETWLADVQTGIAAILFDADHFKNINDTYGHDVGDQVICLMAKCAASFFEAHRALFVRYGGDEFFALCSVDNEQQLHALLESFQCMMHAQSYSDDQWLQISIGATFHEKPVAVDQFIREADEALYNVKQEGRHHFAIYDHSMQ